MALLDVSELMTDPDFVDRIHVITRTPQINSLGEQVLSETTTQTVGSVQPATGATLFRLPDALRVQNVMSFFVKGHLVASDPGKYPTVLVFKGRRFQIQTVFDYSHWGSGYSEGVCIAETPAP